MRTPTPPSRPRKRWWCYLGVHVRDELVRTPEGYYWHCPDCYRTQVVFIFTE